MLGIARLAKVASHKTSYEITVSCTPVVVLYTHLLNLVPTVPSNNFRDKKVKLTSRLGTMTQHA